MGLKRYRNGCQTAVVENDLHPGGPFFFLSALSVFRSYYSSNRPVM